MGDDKIEKLSKPRNHRMEQTRHHSVHNLDKPVRDSLAVVTVIFNPWRYRSRIDLWRDFAEYCEKSGAILYTAEIVLHERPFVITEPDNPRHFRFRTEDELWIKEKAINSVIERLPLETQYIATVDADIRFADVGWAESTIQILQHFPIAQMFSKVSSLNADNEVFNNQTSIMWAYQNGLLGEDTDYNAKHHPGFSWCYRKEALSQLGQLLDIAILGSADRHQAYAYMNKIHSSYPPGITEGYKKELTIWQDRATEFIKGDVGVMKGQIYHYWHGNSRDRAYNSRWKILVEEEYDPKYDIKRDTNGLYIFSNRNPKLKQRIRKYFAGRNEDELAMF